MARRKPTPYEKETSRLYLEASRLFREKARKAAQRKRRRALEAAVAAVDPFEVAIKFRAARRVGRTYQPTRVEQVAIARWQSEQDAEQLAAFRKARA
jgi:nucleoside 2-deoxyribosyltransferase